MSRKKISDINPIVALVLAAMGYRAYQQGRNPFWAILKTIFGFFFAIFVVIAIGGFIASFNSPPIPVNPTAGIAPPASSAVAVSSSGIPALSPTTAVDRLGRVLDDAAIVDATGTVIGMVHQGRAIHIIAVDGSRLRIRKHDGQEGFVAADSVADVGDWIGSSSERMGSP
jgi:hypothetical protein